MSILGEELKLGTRLQQASLINDGVVTFVKVLRGEGKFAYWERQDKFHVVASKKLKRYGRFPAGVFCGVCPRVKRGRPKFRFLVEIE